MTSWPPCPARCHCSPRPTVCPGRSRSTVPQGHRRSCCHRSLCCWRGTVRSARGPPGCSCTEPRSRGQSRTGTCQSSLSWMGSTSSDRSPARTDPDRCKYLPHRSGCSIARIAGCTSGSRSARDGRVRRSCSGSGQV